MRTIKFRGKDIRGWHYGDLRHTEVLNVSHVGIINENDKNETGSTIYIVQEETIGQFTGLYDKNGKEIYENDIVHLDTWKPDAMLISFIEGAFCLTDVNGNYLGDIHYINHAGIEQCTVIGNIVDNPELLEGGEQ